MILPWLSRPPAPSLWLCSCGSFEPPICEAIALLTRSRQREKLIRNLSSMMCTSRVCTSGNFYRSFTRARWMKDWYFLSQEEAPATWTRRMRCLLDFYEKSGLWFSQWEIIAVLPQPSSPAMISGLFCTYIWCSCSYTWGVSSLPPSFFSCFYCCFCIPPLDGCICPSRMATSVFTK